MEFSRTEVESYYQARVPGIRAVQNKLRAPCPIHNGKDLNFAVDPENGFAFCHSQCNRGWDIISLEMELFGLDFIKAKEEVFHAIGRPLPKWQDRDIEATYDYTDEDGNLLYQVVRKTGKRFMQRRPVAGQPGRWQWGLAKITPVPYQLPKLTKTIKEIVIGLCYRADTEILTTRGWLPFPELLPIDHVAQFDLNGTISFVQPSAIQEFEFSGEMCNFKADWCDMSVTPDHRILSRTKIYKNGAKTWCAPTVVKAGDITSSRSYPVSGMLSKGQETLGPKVDLVRLMVAWCADGVDEKRGLQASWNLKKSRKILRLRQLLSANNIPATGHEYASTPGWINLRVNRCDLAQVLNLAPCKNIPMEAVYWPKETRLALLNELRYWDGDSVGKNGVRFFTANKCEADAVAAIAAVSGWGCIVRVDERPERPNTNTQYVVNLTLREWRQSISKPSREQYSGKVHCCTVPTGFVVTRRNGKTTISGNCEGEKDVLNLMRAGWVATCNNGGAGNFKADLVSYFTGRLVAIFADNDEAGRKHAQAVAKLLYPVAASVRIVEIPGLPAKGDVSDYLVGGNTGDDLYELYVGAQDWTPEWEYTTPVPHENDKYLRTFGQFVQESGGYEGFWKSVEIEGIPTPFDGLTRSLGGLRAGEVYVIAANQGAGKSSLGLQFAIAALENKCGVLVFSMEMSHRDVFQRIASIESRVDLAAVRRLRKYGEDDVMLAQYEERLKGATEKFSKSPLYVSTKSSVTVEFLVEEASRVKSRSKIDLVIIDHMQLMGSTGKIRSDYEKFTGISRATKGIAAELGVPLLLISQTSRSNSTDKRSELEVSDIRGSGAIEEDAACVLLLYYDGEDFKLAKQDENQDRLKRGPLKTWLKIGKNRYGPQGTYMLMNHFKSYTRFELAS